MTRGGWPQTTPSASLIAARESERCMVCNKKTHWAAKAYCAKHKHQCKHENVIDVPTGDDVCRDCGAVW